jgi:hypothetical protein
MDPYSATLGLAIAAAACALGLALASRLLPHRAASDRTTAARRGAVVAAGTALTLVSISAALHLTTGHAPGSLSALGPAAFLAMHPALAVTAAQGGLALVLRPAALGRAGAPAARRAVGSSGFAGAAGAGRRQDRGKRWT